MTKEEWDLIKDTEVYCIVCKKKGTFKDIVRPDGTVPFTYDGAYKCEECEQAPPCPTCETRISKETTQ